MTIPADVAEKLAQPLNPARVHKREGGGGRQLSYLEAHDVIRTANDVFGVGEWSYETRELVCLGEEQTQNRDGKQGFRIAYRALVAAQFNGHGFTDVGYGDAVEYTGSRLTPHELAAKEAVSDAVKRCLKNYGDQFGLCLYDKFAPEHRGAQAAPRNAGASTGSSGRGGGSHPPAAAPAPQLQAPQKPAVSSPDVEVPAGMMLAGDVACPLGKNKGVQARALSRNQLKWYAGDEFNPTGADGIAFKHAAAEFLKNPDALVPVDADLPF